MFVALVLLFSLGVSSAVPLIVPAEFQRFIQLPFTANVLQFQRNYDPSGSYLYDVDQSDVQRKYEEAEVRNAGTDNQFLAVKGSYSYLGPDGVLYTVGYWADETGFHAEGEHLANSANAMKKKPKVGLQPSVIGSLAAGIRKRSVFP